MLLISIDTLRSDHLAAYGYERETCPAITQLAAEGARFENSYSQASSTVGTHASILLIIAQERPETWAISGTIEGHRFKYVVQSGGTVRGSALMMLTRMTW